jgi:hypothetical protein
MIIIAELGEGHAGELTGEGLPTILGLGLSSALIGRLRRRESRV